MNFIWSGWNYLVDTFTSLMKGLGLWNKTHKLALIGLDNAGKTIFKHMLAEDNLSWLKSGQPLPEVFKIPIGNLQTDGVTLMTYDLGGLVPGNRYWTKILDITGLEGIVFMIDAADHYRFAEAKKEINTLMKDKMIANVPILVLGNKTDRPQAVSEEELRYQMGLTGQTTGKGKVPIKDLPGRPLELFMCSLLKRQGYAAGFLWLSQYL